MKKKIGRKTKKKITPESSIFEVLQKYPQVSVIFQKFGIYCLNCPFANFENIEMLAEKHKIDLDLFLEELNTFLEEDNKKR
jgi:hybrid cluster-associated redox disulfide protein